MKGVFCNIFVLKNVFYLLELFANFLLATCTKYIEMLDIMCLKNGLHSCQVTLEFHFL